MQFLRWLLLPFSLVYYVITAIRNLLYDRGIRKSYEIPGKSICIGNITVGGTGKSPLAMYIAALIPAYHPAFLSRGYGRETHGLRAATDKDNSETIGDEPFMYMRRFAGGFPVVVAEKRIDGVKYLRKHYENPTILLDDAFQHRAVKAGLNIVLMTYDRPIFRDFVFPAGNLREPASGIRRADIVVVTKAPAKVSHAEQEKFARKLRIDKDNLFFSHIEYSGLIPFNEVNNTDYDRILLVTGIANPKPLLQQLKKDKPVELMKFPDHHSFTHADIVAIHKKLVTFASRSCAVVTTEKDAVKLLDFVDHPVFQRAPWFYQSMNVRINREKTFNNRIISYVAGTDERSS